MSSYAIPPSIQLLLNRTQRGLGRLGARTSAIQSALQPFAPAAAGYYANAQGAQQALGSGLSSSLTSQGAQLGAGISSALQGIQAPSQAVAQYGTGTATTGAQAGATIGALSSADLARLQSTGTAEQIYAAALPRLAALAGDQERRNMLAQAQSDLQDLALQEAQKQADNLRYAAEWAYKMQQDSYSRQRQQKLDRRSYAEQLYQHRQNALKNRRQAALDKLAANAAAKEYGLKAYNTQSEVQYRSASAQARAQSLAERQRHDQATEANAAARTKLAQEKALAGPSSNAASKYWDSTRKDAFKRAYTYKNPKSLLADPMPRAKARVRLWAEFGTALTGKGFKREAVKTMIEHALDAAGY